MKIIEYIRENPRKLLENITSYLTILVGFLGFLISYGAGFGISGENIALIVTLSAGLNRVLTYIRVNFLKEQIAETEEVDDFIME